MIDHCQKIMCNQDGEFMIENILQYEIVSISHLQSRDVNRKFSHLEIKAERVEQYTYIHII